MADLNLVAGTNITLVQSDDNLTINSTADLTGYVKNTDYATYSTGGVFKLANDVTIDSGYIKCGVDSYNDYQTKSNNIFISKGTLENVLTNRIGAIDSVLDAINGEVI